jgi:hypothetical protein
VLCYSLISYFYPPEKKEETMKLSSFIFVFGLLAISNANANADTPIQDLKLATKIQTEVMILGTTHLRAIKAPFDENALAPIVSRLTKFQPSAIAIESLRSADILAMIHGVDEYNSVLTQFVGDDFLELAKSIQEELALTAGQAISKLNTLLSTNDISDEERLNIIQVAIAAYDKSTALLHWSYLENDIKTTALPVNLQQYFKTKASNNNETNLISIPLAKKLQLNRLFSIDDHLDKDLYPKIISEIRPSMKKSKYVSELRSSDYVKKPQMLMSQAQKTNNWLPLFNWVNSTEYTEQVINTEWRLFIDKDMEIKPGLSRVALWEVRNLNMVSNIMRVVSNNIGGKVIVIVGANHKVFFEDYLSRMVGVKIIQFNELTENKLFATRS